MQYESLPQALEALEKLQRTLAAYSHAMGVLNLDATTAAPAGSQEGRGKTMEILSQVIYDLTVGPQNGALFDYLSQHIQELTPVQARQLEVLRKDYDRTRRIPAEEYVGYNVLLNDADAVWHRAKLENDFASFAPYLEKIVHYNRKFAGYYNPELPAYDALLNEYEEGMNTQILDAFFAQMRQTIVPLIAKIQQQPQVDDSFLHLHYDINAQREFSQYLMDVMGLDKTYCAIAETEHPFTENFGNHDVRITTHYHEDDLASSMYSVIHEGGHALYELGADDCYNYTVLSGGVSMGIHESQSRFYENIIGRSPAFISLIFPYLQEKFPQQLANITQDQFCRAVNKAQPSLIRTEADELTYCLHIMVRYELEKQLIAGTLEVKDLPEAWNGLYRQYLGICPPNDTMGCLQDSHWAMGAIGYFPSYALGSAYGAQFLARMEEDLGSVAQLVAQGQLSRVTAWLREHIHRHASFYKPGALFRQVCGTFDARYYTDYLTAKYTQLYGL